MQISKRDFLKKLGLLGAAGVSGAALKLAGLDAAVFEVL